MSAEAQLLIDVWEAVRDHLPARQRAAVALDIVNAMAEFGFEASDLASAEDEDHDIGDAYREVFDLNDTPEEGENELEP